VYARGSLCDVTDTAQQQSTSLSLPSTSSAVDEQASTSTAQVPHDAAGTLSMSTAASSTVPPTVRRLKRQPSVDEQLIQLQKQTLAGVEQLVNIQQQLFEVKKGKFELKREEVALKKAKMAKRGMVKLKMGNGLDDCSAEYRVVGGRVELREGFVCSKTGVL